MSNPWEFNWQWDDLDPAPEAPKPVTTRQQLASQSARANDPWAMNWDWARAEASAGAQDFDRLNPLTTIGDENAARYVRQDEYQMPELLHEEQSQRDFVRPKGEMFHARSYVPGAVPEQRVITEDLPWWEVPLRAVARGGEDVVQTGYAMAGGDPRDIPTMPLTTMDNPMTVADAWDNPEQAAKQSVTMIARLWPMMAAGYAGAAVSGVGAGAAAGAAGTEILGSSAGAMAATFAQSMGPRFKQMLMQYPDDPERAWKEAGNATLLDVGFTGVGGMLIGAGPVGTSFKQAMFQTFGLRPMAELTGRQLAANLAIQTLGVQPLVGVANMRAVDAYLGQDTGLTFGDEFLNNIAPGLVQTGAEMAGRTAIAPFAKKTAPGGVPGGGLPGGGAPGSGTGEHFIDQIMEATELEKLAADFRTSPELAAQIPEGLKYQIDNGADPYRGYRRPLESLNSMLKSKLQETIVALPDGEKRTGQQWYNSLRNAGVKEEELADYGFDMLGLKDSDHNFADRTYTKEQLLGQFEHNDYPIINIEKSGDDAEYAHTDGMSTPGARWYQENLFSIEKRNVIPTIQQYAAKRGIDFNALRDDVKSGVEEAVDARKMLGAEYKAHVDFMRKNPPWKQKHAAGDDVPSVHWENDDSVLMHSRQGDLVLDDGSVAHHLEENQSDYIQQFGDKATRDMSAVQADAARRYASDELFDAVDKHKLNDLSFVDRALRDGVNFNEDKLDALRMIGRDISGGSFEWVRGPMSAVLKYVDNPESLPAGYRNFMKSIFDDGKLAAEAPELRRKLAIAEEVIAKRNALTEYSQTPQSVPLKKSWSKAVLKAEIVRALQQGKNFISWTDGDMQAKRNNVGHQLQELSISRSPRTGRYSVYAEKLGGGEAYWNGNATEETVKRVFGRDLSDKAFKKLDAEGGEHASLGREELGDDTLGGKFHRKLYDEKMVQWAKEIGKKYGVAPERRVHTDKNGNKHGIWVMKLDPLMQNNLYRYQVDGGGEERGLVAVRQMSSAALSKALELGGIPMPSLAIIKAENGLSSLKSFPDDVTLIGTRDLVDPEKGAKAFDSDIYSPGTPRTKYVIDPVAKTKLSKEVAKTAAEIKAPGLTDDIIAKVEESGLVALSESHAVVVQFARSVGELKSSDKVMNSDGSAVERLRGFALAHPEFRPWLNGKFSSLIATKKAVRREADPKLGRKEKLSPHTLESMMRIMESKPLRGANTKAASVAYYRGLSAKRFGSIAEIKSESGKLLPREQTEALFGELQADFDRTIEYLSRRVAAWSGNDYGPDVHTILARKFVKEVLQSSGSARRISQIFEGANATDIKEATDLIKRIDGTATSYFEVKVPSVVDFSSFKAAIVRDDRISAEGIQALRDNGIENVIVVRGDDEQARDLALQGLKHLFFQVDGASEKQVTQSESDTRKVSLTPKQQKQFRKLMQNLLSEIKRINPLADVRFLDRFIGFSKDGTAINVNGISHLLGIGVGLGGNNDPFGTARHEAGHTVMWLMDNLKAWKPGEREAFVEWYENVLSKEHAKFLKSYSPERRFEEAIVQELGVNRNKWKGYPQAVRNALFRIDGILKAIRTAVKRAFGRKLSPEDIAAMFDAGIMARRAIRKMRRLEGKTRGPALARTPDGSLAYQITEETLKDFVISSQLDNTLYGKIDNPAIGTKLKKGTGAQWRAELMKQGVKLEELKDSGLDAYLNDKASSPLTLQDIIAEREAKRVELHVVMADDGGKTYVPEDQGAPTPESLELEALKAEFSDLNLKSALAGIIGRDPGNVNTWLRNRVMERLEADALERVRANPEAFETPADPRHPVYIIDREGEVRGRLVMKNVQSGQSTDLGWLDPINHPYGGRERRSKEVNRKVLDKLLQELKSDMLRLMPRQPGQDEIIIPTKPRDDQEFYYYPVQGENGTTIKIIEGTNYDDVVTAIREYYQRSKVEFSFEYEPVDTSVGRYRAIEIKRGQHELTKLDPGLPYDQLMNLVSQANVRHEQRWLERTSQRHAHKMTLDGNAAFNAAVESIRDGYSVGHRIEELYPSIAYALATEYRHPNSMNSPYPHLDVDRLNRMRELEDRVIGGSYSSGDLKFSSWTLPGGNFRREYLVTAPTLPFTSGENVSTHFSDYANQNVVAHLRLAEFYTAEGEVMNMADEFQSDVMQRASETREQLIKEYGFDPKPDLGFGAKATDEEFGRKWDEAQGMAQENRAIYQNARALQSAMQDVVDVIKLSGNFGGQSDLFAKFGMNFIARKDASLSSDARAKHLAAEFLNIMMSSIDSAMTAREDGVNLSDFFVSSLRYVHEGSTGHIDGDKSTRDAFIRKATEFMKAVPIPEEKRGIFGGVDNMYDLFRFGLKTVRPMSRIATAQSKKVKNYAHNKSSGHGLMIAPERTPHKKSWGLLTFKVALVDAVRRGHKWVGFTTGEQQNTRYRSALQKAVASIKFKKLGDEKANVTIKLREGGDDKVLNNMTRSELARYIGRGASDQIFDHQDSAGSLSGDNIRFNLPGVMDHYDRGIPKEIRPLTDKLKMKLGMKEVGEIDTQGRFNPLHTVQALRITPEAVEAVKNGEILRYQVRSDDLSGTIESQLDTVLMPDSPVRTKLKKGTGAQWRAELMKQGVKVEELRDSGLDDYFTENKDQQLSLDQVFQQRQGNRIDIVMKVLDDGTEPLVQRSKEVKVVQPDQPFDLVEQLEQYGLREGRLSEGLDEAISDWIGNDDDFDNNDNMRNPYEARWRNETVYELVKHEPNGDIEDYIDNYDDDYSYANRQLREKYGNGEREYVADNPSKDGEEWVVAIRDDWGDGEVVETIRAASEDEAVSEAEEYIKDNSPYYSIQEGETDDWGVYDRSEDKWEETGLSKREAERSAERSNDYNYDRWYENANNEAWDILRGDVDRAVTMLENVMYGELDRNVYDELRELPMYDEAVRAYLASEHGIGSAGGGGSGKAKSNSTKFGNWVLRGGRYYREYLLAAPNMDNQGISMRTHFNGVEKNILAHFRANDFQTADGGVALVAQEFQSDVHQDASDVRQTLIKKLGFEPSPTLGYGKDFEAAVKEKATPLAERVDTFNENIESMNITIANALIAKMDDIISAIGLDAFTRDGAVHPNLRADIDGPFKQLLTRIVSDRDHFSTTWKTIREAVRSLSYFRYNVNELTFPDKVAKALSKLDAASNVFPGAKSMDQELRFAAKQIGKLRKSLAESRQALSDVSNISPVAPDRLPHKQSWELLQFKILLHEAIKNGYDYIALTTGDQQVERYGSALKDAIKDIEYDINRSSGKADIKINLNRKDPHKMSGVTEVELARYIGKKAASDVFNSGSDKGTLPSSGVEFKSPGIINHYDRAIQSDTKKFLSALDMKWESLDIGSVTRIAPPPAPKQQWTLIQRGTRPDGTVQEATVVRDTREAIDMIRQNARNISAERLLNEHGFTSYSDELIEPTATNLPAPVEETKFNKMHTVHGVKISDKARMWIQGSPDQPTKRFLKYQVETPDHQNDEARFGARAKPGDNVNTPEFTSWFKKSAAVDKDGRPLPMYRGTQKEPKPTGFYTRKATVSFTPDPHVSSVYTQGPWGSTSPGASVHPVYLSIQKPFDMRAITEHATLAEIVELLPWDFTKNFGEGKFLGLMDLASLVASLDESAPKGGAKYKVMATSLDGVHAIRDFHELSNEINTLDADDMTDADQEALWNMLYDATVDTYVIADDEEWVDTLKGFGYDGIVHKDPFVGGFDKYEGDKSLFEKGHDDDPIHDTWRPFRQEQIKSVFNRGTWSSEDKDIRYQVEHHDTPEFKRFFGKSHVTENHKPGGKPLRVYRGEHGADDGSDIQTKLPSITFVRDPEISSHYAMEPNNWRDTPVNPRSIPAYLRIENPIIKSTDDPFVDFKDLIPKLGEEFVRKMALKHADRIEATGAWIEEFSQEYMMVEEMLEADPRNLNKLYMDVYPLLDDPEFVEAAKAKGYDGAMHIGNGESATEMEYRVFDRRQIKSATGNRGTYDPNDPRINYQIELPDGLAHADPAVNTPRFKVWFKKSKIIDAVGHPLRVFHGSLKAFNAFNSSWGTNEGFFGRRFYFTNHPGDASDNYASRKGPDNQYKMNKYLDQNGTADEVDYWSQMDNEGVVYPVYLSIQNPVVIGGASETRFGYRDMLRLAQAAKHAEKLVSLFDGEGKLSDIITDIMMNETPGSGDYIPANELIKRIRESDGIYEITDENGDNAYAEVLRQAFETLGYDGIVDYGVNSRWKWIKHQNVEHFIAFRPNQIKSVFNRGTWSSRMDDIHYQVASEDPVNSPRFRAWLGDALLRTADGEPLPVYHATGNDFDKFRRARHDIGFHIGTSGQANERFAAKQKYAEQEGIDSFRPNVMKLYTNIRNPITLTDLGHWSVEYVFHQLKEKADSGVAGAPLTSEEAINFALEYQEATGVWKENALFQLKKLLSRKGYDSIVYYNKFEIEGRHAAEEALASAKENHRSALQRMHPGRDPWNLSPTLAPAEWAAVLQAEHNLKEIRKQMVPSYAVFWPNQLKSVFNKGSWSSDKRSIMYQAQWEDAPQSSSFLDSLREGFSGQWENMDEEASLSSNEADLRKVYRKDWLDLRRGPNHFQFALMLRGRPIGRINGVINGDTARLNWIGIIGGDDGLGDGAVRHLGAMLRLKLPNEVRLLTGLRKGPEQAYAAEEQKAAKKPTPSGPSATKVRTPGGSQEDPLIEYYRNLGKY